MTRKEKTAKKDAETRIDRVYRATCANIAIDIFDIQKVFDHGHLAIAEGVDDADARMAAIEEELGIRSLRSGWK